MYDFIIGCHLPCIDNEVDDKYLLIIKQSNKKDILSYYYHGNIRIVKKIKSYREMIDTYYHYIELGFINMSLADLKNFYHDDFDEKNTITDVSNIEVEQTTRCIII